MAEQDPNAQPGSTGDGPAAARGAGGSPSDVNGTIALSEHQAAIEAERRRRAGQERAHQKEIATLRAELTEIKDLVSRPGEAPAPNVRALLSRLDSGDPQAIREAVREGLVAVAQWTDRLSRQEEDQLARQRLSGAVEDAIADLHEEHPGIPRSALDTSSPAAVAASAERYLKDQEVASLKARLEELEKGKTTVEAAVTRTRQEAGATRTLTSTGMQPVTASEVEEELTQRREEVARLKRLRRGPELMAVNRRIQELEAELAAAR